MEEKPQRSIVKGLTWRVLASTDTVLLSYLFTGSITAALSIGGLELITKTVLYYVHERAWIRLPLLWSDGAPEFNIQHKTSLLKAVSWRFVGALDTIVLALIVTGSIGTAASIGVAEIFTKIALYYIHERAWARTVWGRRKKDDSIES